MRATKWIGLIVVVLCAGCAGLGKYAKDRGNDFLDCFQAHAGYGLGADVHVRATQFVIVGAGSSQGVQWGVNGREYVETTELAHFGPPVTTVEGILWLALAPFGAEEGWFNRKWLLKSGALSLALDKMERHTHPGRRGCVQDDAGSILGVNLARLGVFGSGDDVRGPHRLLDSFDMEVGGTALVPSLRLGFSPGQFADFVLGFFGLDIARDDAAPAHAEPKAADKPAASRAQ